MSLRIPLTELQEERLAALGGHRWATELIWQLLDSPLPEVPPSTSGPAPAVGAHADEETLSQILANTAHLKALFCGGSKIIGNAGELAYEQLLRTAFPKVDFVKVSNDGRSGDIRADFADNFRVLIEVKTRANNVPKVEVEAFQASMRARRQHGILVNARGGIVHRPHRINLDIIPADDRQLAAIYLPNNAGDMDTMGLAFNLLRKVGPILDATQGKELIFSLDVFEQVNSHIRTKCEAMREVEASNRTIAALVDKQARQLGAALLDDLSKIFAVACARVKAVAPVSLPLRLTAADILGPPSRPSEVQD